MLTRWGDFDRSFVIMDEFRRRMDSLFEDLEGGETATTASWPRVNLFDQGANLVLVAELPGLRDKDVKLTIDHDVLTIEGERAAKAPEGYTVHRQERPSLRFSRALTLPAKVDSERTTASLQNGFLTITLPKAPEARPRTIAVRG
jgi:HSP20 family protein